MLDKGGRLAITLLPGERMEALGFPREVFRFWSPGDVQALLHDTGFENDRVEHPPDPSMKWLCVMAIKGSG